MRVRVEDEIGCNKESHLGVSCNDGRLSLSKTPSDGISMLYSGGWELQSQIKCEDCGHSFF